MTTELPERKLTTWLFNPAVYVAGMQAMIIGIGVILVSGWIGSLSRTHFDGVLDVHTGAIVPLWFVLSEGVLAWMSVVIVFWIVGKLAGRSSFRFVDIIGTQALARAPMLLVAVVCLLPGYVRFSQALMTTMASGAQPSSELFLTADAAWFLSVLVVMIIAIGWMVTLMYRSYAHVCNIRGARSGWSFVIALILAEVLSKIVIIGLSFLVLTGASSKPSNGDAPSNSAAANHADRQPDAVDTKKAAEEAAVTAAKTWLSLVDGEKYAESWEQAALLFRGAVQKDQWIQMMQSGRKPFGKNLKRELMSKSYQTALPGAPDGQYVVIQFSASFENMTSATETITPMLDKDGQWRVSGYFMK